jgi:hypothetical protein
MSCAGRLSVSRARADHGQGIGKVLGKQCWFQPSYLAGFPESEFDELETRHGVIRSRNVPWYVMYKTMAGPLVCLAQFLYGGVISYKVTGLTLTRCLADYG